MTPEQRARKNIDNKLNLAGWVIQDYKQFNPGAANGVAVREFPTDTGPADYMLFVEREPVGVIEAKPYGTTLVKVEEQSERYAESKIKWKKDNKLLPFVYESTGIETRFTDNRDPLPRSREVIHFHKPETFIELLKKEDTLRARLRSLPSLPEEGLWDCQINAINNLEESFKRNYPRALIQMATGSGKTFTAITSVYRLLKYANAKRILFLVDTRNLGEQAEQEFQGFTPVDDNRKFNELYSVQRLSSSYIAKDSHVCISTIQRMYSILKGEELDPSAEEESLYEISQSTDKQKEVVYNPDVPIEFFDFIIIDECHRSIYNLWKQVLDYFDAFLIGLTATPDKRTFGFFNENVVSEYSHEDAVTDGVNVGFDIFLIETEITQKGAQIKAREFVDMRSKLTREKRWAQLDEEVNYEGKQLDRDVVNPSQIRNIIRTFRDKVTTVIFPERKEVPKTLIFAKSDSHADDIIQIVREEFSEGNDFCKKVTYNTQGEKPSDVLQQFRTAYNPRIAVTVDMIATGTDVKPIECLIFMRDVKSRSYFEQMKGRGTRTLSRDDLKKVTPSAAENKDRFVIIDAVGVSKSIKTDSRPLERKPSVSLKDLMLNVVMGSRDEDTVTSLANRLTRLDKKLTPEEKKKFNEYTNGKSVSMVVRDLLESYNPDTQIEKAKEKYQLPENTEPTEEQIKDTTEVLTKNATKIFDKPEIREYVEKVRRSHEQIIDTLNIDTVTFSGYEEQSRENAEQTIQNFREFIEQNKDEITALKIYYNQPYNRRNVTYKMIKELVDLIKESKPAIAPLTVWKAYERLEKVNGRAPLSEITALVALIRKEAGIDSELTNYSETINQNFKDWVFKKNAGNIQFTDEQMEWLRMIKDYIVTSIHIDKEDLDLSPFVDKGGLGKMWKLFGDKSDELLDELNEELVA